MSLVVTQYYEADVNKEHVIRGNSAVMKCLIPSFVADFVEVVSWHTDENDTYFARTTDMGSFVSHKQRFRDKKIETQIINARPL